MFTARVVGDRCGLSARTRRFSLRAAVENADGDDPVPREAIMSKKNNTSKAKRRAAGRSIKSANLRETDLAGANGGIRITVPIPGTPILYSYQSNSSLRKNAR
jgi:hypothetical protein